MRNQSEEDIVRHLTHAIGGLPQPNRDTLAFLILHFQRVAECPEVSMSLKNLGRIFAPIIFGKVSDDLDQDALLAEIYLQYTIMEHLLKISNRHLIPYVSLETEQENSENFTNLLQARAQFQEKLRSECEARVQHAERWKSEVDVALQSIVNLVAKLYHACRFLQMEKEAAEHERDQMEQKLLAVADLLWYENNLKNETKDKLTFLNNRQQKRKSKNPHLEEISLSDLYIAQSEDEPSVSNAAPAAVGTKRLRLSAAGGTKNMPSGGQRSARRSRALASVATTKFTIPQDGQGAIRAESAIETAPPQARQELSNDVITLPEKSRRYASIMEKEYGLKWAVLDAMILIIEVIGLYKIIGLENFLNK
uniref:Rho-GAP domain-containing protein n=1 Tax=Glossina palpalis gambiensis TaxID=67801 RepID=A0A1B0BWL2_9MUSC